MMLYKPHVWIFIYCFVDTLSTLVHDFVYVLLYTLVHIDANDYIEAFRMHDDEKIKSRLEFVMRLVQRITGEEYVFVVRIIVGIKHKVSSLHGSWTIS